MLLTLFGEPIKKFLAFHIFTYEFGLALHVGKVQKKPKNAVKSLKK